MQNVNSFVKLRNVHYTGCIAVLCDTDFARPWPDCAKRLPVVGFLPMLHLIKLLPSLTPRIIRERSQIVEDGIDEIDILRFIPLVTQNAEYTKTCMLGKIHEPTD